MFTLTRRERNVVLYVLISAVIGLGVRRCRESHRQTPVPADTVEAEDAARR